jgi:hypothetical protein
MSNMSYCRFHNTASALQDCVEVLLGESEHYPNKKSLSREEQRAYENMKELCESFLSATEEFEEREGGEPDTDEE